MNATLALNQRQTERASAARGKWSVVVVLVPVALLLLGGVALGIREFRAGRELQARKDRLTQAGEHYDNASMDRWYRNHTRSEGTQDWVRVLDSISAISQLASVDSLPFVGKGAELPELDPQAKWRDEPNVKEFLTEMQALIQKIHQLKQWPTPVQMPHEMHGFQTLLPHEQQSRSMAHLLQLDFEHAFYSKDFDRALEDLQSIGTVAKAIDSDLCLVVELIAIAIVGTQHVEIQRSLLTDSWPEEKLSSLRKLVGPVRYTAAKWKNLFSSERAMSADLVESGDFSQVTSDMNSFNIPLFQTGRVRIFDLYDELISVGSSELAALRPASTRATQRMLSRDSTFSVDGANFWIGMLFPSIEQMARAFENEENTRRLTLTAIALRQFKHQQGSWPTRLSELTNVGLTTNDIGTVNRGAFGYETENGVAYLWGSDLMSDSTVSEARPTAKNLEENRDHAAFVTLR